jgi:methionine biosynthesis protein MetW
MNAPGQHLPYSYPDGISRLENEATYASILEAVKKYVPKGSAVLDVGSGRGEIIERIAGAGYRATGCDIDDECVRLSSRFGNVVKLDIEKITDGSFAEKFECVILSHVLEHVGNPRDLISRLASISNRYLIVSVPNPSYTHSLARTLSGRIDFANRMHLFTWDWFHFRTIIEISCGLEIVEYFPDSVAFPLPLKGRLFLDRAGVLEPLETKLLRRLLPRFCRSITAVIKV